MPGISHPPFSCFLAFTVSHPAGRSHPCVALAGALGRVLAVRVGEAGSLGIPTEAILSGERDSGAIGEKNAVTIRVSPME